METKTYTVGEVASLLQLHPKTVLRKIREGALSATRIGKQYRISAADLNSFGGGIFTSPEKSSVANKRQVLASSVVDVDAISPEESSRITNSAMAVLAGRNNQGARLDCLYYEETGKMKIIVHGDLQTTQELLALVESLLEPHNG